MELLIKNIKSQRDIKLFNELAERLGLKTSTLSLKQKEDIALAAAIEEGIQSGFASEKTILKTLQKIKGKK